MIDINYLKKFKRIKNYEKNDIHDTSNFQDNKIKNSIVLRVSYN